MHMAVPIFESCCQAHTLLPNPCSILITRTRTLTRTITTTLTLTVILNLTLTLQVHDQYDVDEDEDDLEGEDDDDYDLRFPKALLASAIEVCMGLATGTVHGHHAFTSACAKLARERREEEAAGEARLRLAVLDYIEHATYGESGLAISYDDVALKAFMTEQNTAPSIVRRVLAALAEEGLVYQTIDVGHFAATDRGPLSATTGSDLGLAV